MDKKILSQYDFLNRLNGENHSKLLQMKKEYEEAVGVYEDLQSQIIQEEINRIILIVKELFPKYEISPTKFGIRISCNEGISDSDNAIDEKSGLGDYNHGEEIYKILVDKLGPIIKTEDEDIAWFDPKEDSEYDEKTSWVYTWIEYVFKKSYLKEKFNLKSAPISKI